MALWMCCGRRAWQQQARRCPFPLLSFPQITSPCLTDLYRTTNMRGLVLSSITPVTSRQMYSTIVTSCPRSGPWLNLLSVLNFRVGVTTFHLALVHFVLLQHSPTTPIHSSSLPVTVHSQASRSAAQGLIGFARDDDSAVLVELNSETDFVSRNEQFTSLLSQIAQAALRQTPKDSSACLHTSSIP